jgi:hypothetical protein
MSEQHTATPWNLELRTLFNGGTYLGNVVDAAGETIRVTGFALSSGLVAEANAAFIVRAVNAHDDLVNAAKAVLAEREGEIPTAGWLKDSHDSRKALSDLAAALAKAGA